MPISHLQYEIALDNAKERMKQKLKENPNLKPVSGTENMPIPLYYDTTEYFKKD